MIKSIITKQEILNAQQLWGQGIVKIGDLFQRKEDYKQAATNHIKTLYNYDHGTVLFKPTLTSEHQFRNDFDGALSYFVSGNYKEDNGFAIKPWSKVRFGEQDMVFNPNCALAMGNYFFTPVGSNEEVKVEFTFGYVKDGNGTLRINVHHSSLPYSPE